MSKDVTHLQAALEKDIRYDGRKKTEFREIKIETNLYATAEGSAKVTCGDCEVIAGVKLSLGTPFSDTPDAGVLMVGCELLPIAHESIESGPPGINAIEIGRVIDRGIRESKAFDVKKLCITAGEQVWMVSVDIVPLNHDGNIIDLGALAAISALKTTKFPQLVDGKVDYKKPSKESLVLDQEPIPVTVCKIGKELFVDPTKVEEDQLDARITVTVLKDGNICSLQKGGECGFTIEELDKAFDLAVKTSKELRKKL